MKWSGGGVGSGRARAWRNLKQVRCPSYLLSSLPAPPTMVVPSAGKPDSS